MNNRTDKAPALRCEAWFGLRYFRDVLNGNPTWFERMNGLGPSLTPSPKKAARFKTKQDAGNVRFAMGAMHSVCFNVEPLPNAKVSHGEERTLK
jgi:hypothetical protein